MPLPPGATLGILGGGQLGRMLALAARPLGYRVAVLDPDPDCPAAGVADLVVAAPYDDPAGLERLGRASDAVTLEFENVPAGALEAIVRLTPVRPAPAVLAVARDRRNEKRAAAEAGLATAPWAAVESEADLERAVGLLPGILKTATLGYDGQGQARAASPAELRDAWERLGRVPCVLEGLVSFRQELSVVVARSTTGAARAFAPFENRHRAGVLDLTVWPARADREVVQRAVAAAERLARELRVEGLLTVELFVTSRGRVLVNETAPRPHNSGHLTIEAAPVSQFEQAVRAVAGLPLGEVAPRSPAAMANLFGDLWARGEPDWPAALRFPGVSLHLYGKREARPGRKMGHLTALAGTPEEALDRVERARDAVAPRGR